MTGVLFERLYIYTGRAVMNSLWIKVAIISGAIIVGLGSYLITQHPDGAVEQAAESVLRTQGIDVDLSPDTDWE